MFKKAKMRFYKVKIFVLFVGLMFNQSVKSNFLDFLCFSWCSQETCFWCSRIKLSEICFNRGKELYNQGNREEAEKEYRDAIELNPNNLLLRNNLGNLLKNLKKYKAAEKEYQNVIELSPNNADAYFNLGTLILMSSLESEKIELERLQDAKNNLKLAMKFDFGGQEIHVMLGMVFFLLKNFQEAEGEFTEAINLKSNLNYSVIAHSYLSRTFLELGKLEAAKSESKKAIELDPNCARAHFTLGQALYGLNNYAGAIKELEKAIELDLRGVEIRDFLAKALDKLGRKKEAEKTLRENIKLYPNSARACLQLGIFFYNYKKYPEAKVEFKEAIKIEPNSLEAHISLLNVFVKLNEGSKALNEYDMAAKYSSSYYVLTHIDHIGTLCVGFKRVLKMLLQSVEFIAYLVAHLEDISSNKKVELINEKLQSIKLILVVGDMAMDYIEC
jgi:tetratricopeptide (TPR) repeat protein